MPGTFDEKAAGHEPARQPFKPDGRAHAPGAEPVTCGELPSRDLGMPGREQSGPSGSPGGGPFPAMGLRESLERTLRQWFVAPSSGVHFDVADGIRGIAIILVVASHAFYFNPDGPRNFRYVGQIISSGWLGVPLFFVLSGFLISLPFFRERRQNPSFWYQPGYARRRALKIFPPFYLTIVVLLGYYYWRYLDPVYFKLAFVWASGIAHFIYFPKYFDGSFWSLWVELGFYLVLPLLFLASRGAGTRKTGGFAFIALLVVAAFARYLAWPADGDGVTKSFATNRFPGALDYFGWGVLFSSFYLSRPASSANSRSLGRLGYVGLFSLLFTALFVAYRSTTPRATGRADIELIHLLPSAAAFLLLFFVFNAQSWGARFISSPILRFVGVVSYEWFLIHQPLLNLFREWFSSAHGNVLRYLFMVVTPCGLSLALAILIYHKFSLPIMRWGRGGGRRSGTPPPAQTGRG